MLPCNDDKQMHKINSKIAVYEKQKRKKERKSVGRW